jgi:hypothetical protein
MKYFETSARSGENVENMFTSLTTDVFKNKKAYEMMMNNNVISGSTGREESGGVNLSLTHHHHQSYGCC